MPTSLLHPQGVTAAIPALQMASLLEFNEMDVQDHENVA